MIDERRGLVNAIAPAKDDNMFTGKRFGGVCASRWPGLIPRRFAHPARLFTVLDMVLANLTVSGGGAGGGFAAPCTPTRAIHYP